MYINQELCVGCGKCIPYCPLEAISLTERKAGIDLERCVECGVCKKNAGCPRDAIYNIHLEAPRAYRKAFSDPFGKHENTSLKHSGRGTEEVKTNDVTGIVSDLEHVTFALELGRPGVSASFLDFQTIIQAVLPYAERFEVNNPLTALIADKEKGLLEPSVLGERVMSAIIEFSCKSEQAGNVLLALREAEVRVDTVFSVCMICRVDEVTDTIPVLDHIEELELDLYAASAKTNLGLGRPRYEERVAMGQGGNCH